MNISEIVESAVAVWTKSGTKNVRKFRCSSGQRKGQVVASPATCTKPKNVKASRNLKQTKAKKSSAIKLKRSRTLTTNPASSRLGRLNKSSRHTIRPKKRSRKL